MAVSVSAVACAIAGPLVCQRVFLGWKLLLRTLHSLLTWGCKCEHFRSCNIVYAICLLNSQSIAPVAQIRSCLVKW